VLKRIDVDKAWGGVAYLLSVEKRATDDLYLPADPLPQAVLDNEERLGYGWFEEGREPLILNPAQVRSIPGKQNAGNSRGWSGPRTGKFLTELQKKVDETTSTG
jgi:hypothetical protein